MRKAVKETLATADLNSIYLLVGTLVVMNIGAIGTGVVFLIRMAWTASKYDSRIVKLEQDMNAAHEKIRKAENGKG